MANAVVSRPRSATTTPLRSLFAGIDRLIVVTRVFRLVNVPRKPWTFATDGETGPSIRFGSSSGSTARLQNNAISIHQTKSATIRRLARRQLIYLFVGEHLDYGARRGNAFSAKGIEDLIFEERLNTPSHRDPAESR